MIGPASPSPVLLAALILSQGAETSSPSASPAFLARASRTCAACHPVHASEWSASVHAHAARPDDFAGSTGGGDRSDTLCGSCHGPLEGVLGRSLPQGHPLDLSHGAERTVSCTTCHQLLDEHARSQPHSLPGGTCLAEGAVRPSPDVLFHRSKSMFALRQAETCGPCHESRTPGGAPLERTYSQYLSSIFPDRAIACVTCHMRPYTGQMVPGGPIRYRLHRHDWIGVDVAAEPVPGAGPQADRVLAFLRSALLVGLRAPESVEAGGEIALEVDLKNVGAGHNFPAGPAGERRMWIEVTATCAGPPGAGERTIFASGAPGPDGEPAPEAHLVELGDRLLDAAGKETDSPRLAARVEERSLRAMETRKVSYRLPVTREEEPGATVRIGVRLLFRAAPRALLEKRGLGGIADRYPVLELFRGEAGPIRVVERDVGPEVVRVPEDRPSISEALAAAPPGGTVLVGPGVHLLDLPLELPPGKQLSLRSRAGAERTVLRMSDRPLDPRKANVIIADGVEGSVIAGFTIEGGRGKSGGGLSCRGSALTLEGVVVRGNRAEGRGGGMHAVDSRLDILDSRFLRNRAGGAGGGLASEGSVVRILRSRFAGNSAGPGGGGPAGDSGTGGAIAGESGSLFLEEAVVEGNWAERGGGIAAARSSLKVLRSRLTGNQAGTGAGIDLSGEAPAVIGFTLIAGNVAVERGGGMAIREGAAPVLNRVTIAGNAARGGGGVLGDRRSRATVRNSIVWDNRPPLVTGKVEHSVVDDPRHRGGSNPDLLPLFESAEGEWVDCGDPPDDDCVPMETEGGAPAWRRFVPGDYRLIYGSPPIDAADPREPADPDGTRADLGAFHCPQPARAFVRGDVDGDGDLGSADAVLAAKHLFLGLPLSCAEAADYDDSGSVGVLDLVWLLARSHGLGPPPRPPFPGCGLDVPAADGPGCFESPPRCR